MGMSYFFEYMNTDANVCNNCKHFEIKDEFGKKYHCKSAKVTSTEMKKISETTTKCPELEVRSKSGLDSKSSKGGIGGKLKDATIGKAKREAKAAVMRDVSTIKRNLLKGI